MSLYCFLWKVGDDTYVYTVSEDSLLGSLIALIHHEPAWAGFRFRALENYLIHDDDQVQTPKMLGNNIFVYYI